MCGIAGIVDLACSGHVDAASLARMAAAQVHRGPDEKGLHLGPGIGLTVRRLSIIDIEHGHQPFYNEDRSVVAVYNGELFDHHEQRRVLATRGHAFRSSTDGEIIVHLWEDHGERFLDYLHGQFALALYDRRRRLVILARDRVGICPLHWARVGNLLLFASEVKALLATDLIVRRPDLAGLDNIFTFFGMPSERTAFAGIQQVRPGRYLSIDMQDPDRPRIEQHTYWDLDFPNRGEERNPADERGLIDELDATLRRAVERRLRADVPVGVYLSSGVDSALVSSMVGRESPGGFTSFTARVGRDESGLATRIAQQLGAQSHVVDCDPRSLAEVLPAVVQAADCPVVDTNAGSLFLLSRSVAAQGLKVVLAGEGADEALAGYLWFKYHKFFQKLDWGPWTPFRWCHQLAYRMWYPRAPRGEFTRINGLLGGYHAQTMVYHLTSGPKWILLRDDVLEQAQAESAYDQLCFDSDRVRRWHPLNQSLYFGYKTMLPGLLLSHRGDRVAMANSVEVRYPYLDDDVIQFCSTLHPRWKLRGMHGDKYLQRCLAVRYLDRPDAYRKKKMFRAPFAGGQQRPFPAYVQQLLSVESLDRSGYFRTDRVRELTRKLQLGRVFPPLRLFYEMALSSVIATQLWHHLYLGGDLCELPTWSPPSSDPESLAAPQTTDWGGADSR